MGAGQIRDQTQWVPLSALLEHPDLAELQNAALDGANATVTPQGELVQQAR